MGKAKHPHNSSRPSPKAVKLAIAKGDMDALYRALTPRQRAFAKEYLVDYEGKAACIRAGYSPNCAERQAYLLLHHEGIAKYMEHLQLSKAAKMVDVTPEWIVSKIVAGVVEAEDMKQLTAYFRGLELLARHKGMLTDKQEISGPDGEAIRVQQEEVKKEADSLKQLIEAMTKRTFVITDQEEISNNG